jgi:hypothetical protein
MLFKRLGSEGVSEVVGNLLILLMTVALFGVVLGFIYSIPGPEPTLQAEIVPWLERTAELNGTIHLQHTGGEPLHEGEAYILVSINDTPQRYSISDGMGGDKVMYPGDTWSHDFIGSVSTSAKVDVKIVDKTSNSLLFYTVVQRGVGTTTGTNPPIIAYAWVDATTESDVIPNNDYTTFRIYAVCKDLDGNLPTHGAVWVDITSTDNGDGTASVMAFGAGSTALTDIVGDGVYMSGLLKIHTTVLPADYSFLVTAMDDTGRSTTAIVKITVSTASSSMRLSGDDETPTLLKAGDVSKVFLKLEFLANGESIHTNQIRIHKLGTIPNNRVTLRAYWDQNRNGILDIGTDYNLPGTGTFDSSAKRDFVGSPLFTAIEDEPTYVWIVLDIWAGTEGYSIGVEVQASASVTCIGVSTPIVIPPLGNFPIQSSVLTIKGVFKVWGYNVQPARVLTNTNDVRFIRLYYVATGETVYIKTINITLCPASTIAMGELQAYLWSDRFGTITGAQPFIGGVAQFNHGGLGWKVDKAWSSHSIYVYLNIQGANGNLVGVQSTAAVDTHAVTEISLDNINPTSSSGWPLPPPPTIITLRAAGSVTHDRVSSTEMPARAGDTSVYQRRMLFRCYGEPIEFYSFNFTLMGTISWNNVTNIRLRVYSAYPVGIAYDTTISFNSNRWAKFENGGVPLFTVQMNEVFYGYVYLDWYIGLDHGTEGETVYTQLLNSARVDCVGQITGTPITITPYGGSSDNFPIRGDQRTVNGQLYAYGTPLIPSPLVDSSQNVPVQKITLKCEGQDVFINSFTINKLGTVAMNLVTVRIYHDVNNDTTNKLNADDVELRADQAGNFVANAITFNPNIDVIIGTDYNIVIAFSLGLGTATYNLGCQVSALAIGTTTAAPNLMPAFPNQCLNLTRNPPIVMPTSIVPVSDRGTLKVYMEDLSPLNPQEDVTYTWMKLTFVAEGEDVEVNRIHFQMMNNSTPGCVGWSNIWIYLVWDKNNNSVYNGGTDVFKGSKRCDSNGEAEFIALPIFTVKQGVDYNLLIGVHFDEPSWGYSIMNITSGGDIQSKGQVSALSITPQANFPLMTTERWVIDA